LIKLSGFSKQINERRRRDRSLDSFSFLFQTLLCLSFGLLQKAVIPWVIIRRDASNENAVKTQSGPFSF
jgi:hypothetical protein